MGGVGCKSVSIIYPEWHCPPNVKHRSPSEAKDLDCADQQSILVPNCNARNTRDARDAVDDRAVPKNDLGPTECHHQSLSPSSTLD